MKTHYRRCRTHRGVEIGEIHLDKDGHITGIGRVELFARTPQLLELLLDKIDGAWKEDILDIRTLKLERNGLRRTEPRFS